jgi:hypothetical protein
VTALFASDTGKPVVKVTAFAISINDPLDIRTEKPIPFFKPFIIDLFECF